LGYGADKFLSGLLMYLCKAEYVFEGVGDTVYGEDGEGAWTGLVLVLE
jgi:hypothetical protein